MSRKPKSLLLAAAATLCAAGAFAFTLNTPPAGSQPPISYVALILEFPSSVIGGAVSVDGKSIAVPALGSSASDNTANGDRVKVSTVDATHIRVDITIRQVLQAPLSDRCTLKTVSGVTVDGHASLDIQVSGVAAPTGYRFSAWQSVQDEVTTPGSPQRPSCFCSSRRVKAGAAWGGSAPGTNLGRMPIDIALVLDRSGSMGTTDSSGFRRWDSLQAAAGSVISTWQAEGLGASTTGGTNLGTDRLGLVYFHTSAIPFIPTGATNIFARRDLAGGWDQINASIQGAGPLDSTSLGGGIKAAINAWEGDPQNDLTLLVMSDGIQNTAPMVNDGVAPEALGLKVLDIDGGPYGANTPLSYWCVPMLTVALGYMPGTSYEILLNDIAGQTSGKEHFATPGTLPATMLGDLVEALKGNTLSTVTQVQGLSVPTTGNVPFVVPAHLDQSVKAAILVVQYAPGTSGRGVLFLRSAETGSTAVKPDQTYSGRNYAVYHFGSPTAGDWKFNIGRDASGNIPYTVTVLADEKSLDFDARFRGHTHPTTVPLVIDTLVSYDGVGVDNLQSSMQVQMQKPDGALGNLLHEPLKCAADKPCPAGFTCDPASSTCAVTGAADAGTGDQPSPIEQRIAAQFPDGGLTGTSAGNLTLTSSGGGRYTVSFTDTNLPGRYVATLIIDWTTPQGNHLTRKQVIETQVTVVPDKDASTIAVNPIGPGVMTVVVDPRDKNGNYQGPGFDRRLSVKVGDPAVSVDPIQDPKVTGSYVARLSNVTGDPVVTLSWGGVEMKTAPLSKLPQAGYKSPNCAHCKLGALVYFAIVALIARRRRRT